jgi:hypothetical protein
VVRSASLARHCVTKVSTSGYFQLIRNLAAPISLAIVFSGSFALGSQSVEAKTSGNSSCRARDYSVPPPPPYTPTIVSSALSMTNAQAVTADADDAVMEKPVNPHGKYVFEAKASRNSSRRARDYFVPPPPPYTPSIVSLALNMTYAQTVTANADDAVVKKPVNLYSKYIFTRNKGDMPQVVQPNAYVSYNPAVEKRILKHIDDIDSEISSHEKEIGKLLNL